MLLDSQAISGRMELVRKAASEQLKGEATMWIKARIPLAIVIVFDMLLIGGIVVLRGKGTYEAAMLTAYFVGAAVGVQVVLCITGYIIDKGPWQAHVYVGHLIASIAVFIVTELGGLR